MIPGRIHEKQNHVGKNMDEGENLSYILICFLVLETDIQREIQFESNSHKKTTSHSKSNKTNCNIPWKSFRIMFWLLLCSLLKPMPKFL